MRASLRSVFLLLMVFACVSAAGAAPRLFTLTSGKTVEGEVVFVGRDEVMLKSALDQPMHLPLTQFTLKDQTALVQWGRARDKQWANVVVRFVSGQETDRIRSNTGTLIKTFLVGKMTIQNRSTQPLQKVKVVSELEFKLPPEKTSDRFLQKPQDAPLVHELGTLDVGATLEREVANIQVREEKASLQKTSQKGTYSVFPHEQEREIAMLRVSVYVGPELIWHQRVK